MLRSESLERESHLESPADVGPLLATGVDALGQEWESGLTSSQLATGCVYIF